MSCGGDCACNPQAVDLAFREAEPFIEREIRELLERNVPVYALPASYEFRDKLPTTLIGKVAFKKLENEEKKKRKS